MFTLDYVPIESAVDEYLTMTGARGTARDKQHYKKIANDIVSLLTFKHNLVHKIKLFNVKDNCIELGDNFALNVQVLFRHPEEKITSSVEVVEWATHLYDCEDCEFKIRKECPTHGEGCKTCGHSIEIDATPQMMNAHPQFSSELGKSQFKTRHGGLANKDKQIPRVLNKFVPARPAQHNFFNADYHIRGCLNLDKDLLTDKNVPEYRIDYPMMYFNVPEGEVLLSYLEYKADDDGYRLIPNIPEVFEAIRWGIRSQDAYKDFLRSKDPVWLRDHESSEVKKQKALLKARHRLKMIDFDSWWNIVENYLMKMHNYYDWYKNYSRYKPDPYSTKADRLFRRNG